MDNTSYQIRSLQDFRRVAGETLSDLRELLTKSPGYAPFISISRQLEAILEWTSGDRRPTPEQKDSINMGLVAARELETDPDPSVRALTQRLYDLSAYFEDHV